MAHDNKDISFAESLRPDQVSLVHASQKFSNFLNRAREGFDFRGGIVHKVCWFGPRKDKVGYILFEAQGALTHEGAEFPGNVTLIRGDAVAVMIVLVDDSDGSEWTVLVRQPRIAAGDADYEEIPAGMVDEGVFMSTALRELEEEVGADLEIAETDLHLLRTFMPSPGGCDETIKVYYARKEVSTALIGALRGRKAGAADEGEVIGVEVVPLHDLSFRAPTDAKAIVAYYGYMAAMGLVALPGPVSDAQDAQVIPEVRVP